MSQPRQRKGRLRWPFLCVESPLRGLFFFAPIDFMPTNFQPSATRAESEIPCCALLNPDGLGSSQELYKTALMCFGPLLIIALAILRGVVFIS